MIYKGYVLASELWRKCGVSCSLFRPEHGFDIEKIGNYNAVKVETLPEKYKTIAKNSCTDLERYLPMREFEKMIGVHNNFIASMVSQNILNIETKKVYKANLVYLTDDFIRQIKKGMIPFYIGKYLNKSEKAETTIDMHGMKIGFY